jgi:hypothetical protein
MIAAFDANLAAATDNTIVIPGHGKPVSNKSEPKKFRDMLVDIRDKVAALKKAGRTQQETIAAKPTAAHDAKWASSSLTRPFSRSSLTKACEPKRPVRAPNAFFTTLIA